jgi:hypothetical protein
MKDGQSNEVSVFEDNNFMERDQRAIEQSRYF